MKVLTSTANYPIYGGHIRNNKSLRDYPYIYYKF